MPYRAVWGSQVCKTCTLLSHRCFYPMDGWSKYVSPLRRWEITKSIMLRHIKPNSCSLHWSHDWNLWIYSSERYSLAAKQHFHCTVCHFVPSTIIALWLNCCFNMSNHRREYHFYFLLKICKPQICNDFQGVIILHLLFVERNLLFGHICKTLLNDRWTLAEP